MKNIICNIFGHNIPDKRNKRGISALDDWGWYRCKRCKESLFNERELFSLFGSKIEFLIEYHKRQSENYKNNLKNAIESCNG